MLAQPEEVGVGKHRALRVAGGSRGVKLKYRIVAARRREGDARRRIDLRSRGIGADDPRTMVEPPGKLLGHPVEPRAREDDLRPRVVDDERPFGGRKAPAEWKSPSLNSSH